ncbi:unnamed protein product [Urochloa humidicola]
MLPAGDGSCGAQPGVRPRGGAPAPPWTVRAGGAQPLPGGHARRQRLRGAPAAGRHPQDQRRREVGSGAVRGLDAQRRRKDAATTRSGTLRGQRGLGQGRSVAFCGWLGATGSDREPGPWRGMA